MTTGTASPFIVRAERLAALRTAETIVSEARAEAERLLAAAHDAAEAVAEAARTDGYERGLSEVADLLSRAADAADLHLAERQDELREVAFAVAHRILRSVPRDEVVVRLAREAIADHGRDTRISIRVPPEAADALGAALGAMPNAERVSVIADPTLRPGECALLHPHGRTDVGLLAQFRAMLGAGHPMDGGAA